jgi:hypothetical protein
VDFGSWPERERRGYILFLGWKEYWLRTRGWSPQFRNRSPEEIRKDPQFEKFCAAAEWLTGKGRTVGYKLQGWKRYLAYRCDHLIHLGQRPSPMHLISDYHLSRFNGGCGMSEEAAPQRTKRQLFRIYRRALHPTLRSTRCLQVMGIDRLLVGAE